jgi:hypothetical protein
MKTQPTGWRTILALPLAIGAAVLLTKFAEAALWPNLTGFWRLAASMSAAGIFGGTMGWVVNRIGKVFGAGKETHK